MKLHPGFRSIAEAAALELSSDDIKTALQDCLNDEGGQYSYICAVYGDSESGDVVYYQGGDYCRAPYEIGMVNGKRTHNIMTDQAINVLPRTVWDEEADEDDQVAGMAEAARKAFHVEQSKLTESNLERFPGSAAMKHWPLAERFISKDERDAADDSDFAGTGKSFPILKPGDVKAAVSSIGRGVAGGQSATTLKNKIKAIAKRKGWTKYLPKAWQDDGGDKEESKRPVSEGVLLEESARFASDYDFSESTTKPALVKIISPGRGSSGYYTKELLQRDGPEVFKAGTHMYINHATDAEEAERPEGDYNNLAAVTTGNAYWDENGRDGPALYAPADVYSKFAAEVKEKAKDTGVSIRARGHYAEAATGKPNPKVTLGESKTAPDGKPGLIGKLVHANSIDIVTRAGRDGKIFMEGARPGSEKGTDMEKKEVEALIKESVAPLLAENGRLKQQLAAQGAIPLIRESLAEIRLPEAAKQKVMEAVVLRVPVAEDGTVDKKKLNEIVEAEALNVANLLASVGYGQGVQSFGARLTEAEIEKQLKEGGKGHEEAFEESMSGLAELFVGPKLAKGGDENARSLRKVARKNFIQGRAA